MRHKNPNKQTSKQTNKQTNKQNNTKTLSNLYLIWFKTMKGGIYYLIYLVTDQEDLFLKVERQK